MPNYCDLPDEFSGLAGRVNHVHKVSENEYHSSCPNCGGDLHPDGAPPDRFVMWIVSRSGTPFGMCLRGHCGWKWSPNKEDAAWTPEERAEMIRKRAEIEKRREEKIAQIADKVMEHAYYVRCWKEGKQSDRALNYWLNERKIPLEWVDFLRLGVWGDYKVTGRNSTYHCDAYTIPVWTYGNKAENIKLRVSNPRDQNDRYRNVYKSGAQHLYTTRYDLPSVGNKNIVLEGEIKTITVSVFGGVGSGEEPHLQGWQSKSPEPRIFRMYENAEVIYLALDPDAYYPDNNGNIAINKAARALGVDRVRYVIPPRDQKFDDAILDGYNFRNAVNMAIKPQKWTYWK